MFSTSCLLKNHIYNIYLYKQDLALNKPQNTMNQPESLFFYPWERYEPPYPLNYGLNSTTTILL